MPEFGWKSHSMKNWLHIPLALIFALSCAAQTPVEPVRKVIATDAITEDLDFLTGRTLTVGSGATFTYSAGASFGGSASEFRTDIGAFGPDAGFTYSAGTLSLGQENVQGGQLILFDAVGSASGSIIFHDQSGGNVVELTTGGITGARAITFPDASGALVLNDNTATLTGKTISGSDNTITNIAIGSAVSGLGTGVATALGVNTGSAGAVVLFNGAGGTPSSLTLTNATGLPINTGLTIASQAQGDILYYNGTNWTRLAAGTSGHYLQTQGAGANPQWAAGGGASLGANTFTRLQTITQGTANEGIIASTGYSLTGSNAANMVDLAGTWNTTGVPTAIKLNITNTASGTGSKLLDLQVGGSSKVNVDVDGYLNFLFAGDFVRFLKAGASSGGGQMQIMWRESASQGVFCDANSNFFLRFGRGVCAVDGTLGFSAADSALSPDTYIKRRGASVIGIEGESAAGGILEFLQATSGGTPSSNSARIYAKDVAGTAEVFVKDEAGNETQISPHNHTAPASLIDSAFDEIGYSANVYTGVVQYTNQQRKAKGRADYLHVETFAEHNTRLGLTGGAALVQLDWATVQAAKVAERDALRAAWQARKTAWESDPANSGRPFPDAEPPILEAKPVPAWLTAQLSAKDAYITYHDGVEQEAASRAAKRVTVGSAVAGLRSWASDAQTATANWDGWTQAQKNAATKTMMTRFGTLCDRLADLIEAQSLDKN
jgi:hypothetical protein